MRHDRGLLAGCVRRARGPPPPSSASPSISAPRSAAPLARLLLAEALATAGRPDEAEGELRAVALEPVSPADLPDTLVARMSQVQGLIALRRGNFPLAARRLREAETGWLRRCGQGRAERDRDAGQGYVAALIDLGRPPMTALVEPAGN